MGLSSRLQARERELGRPVRIGLAGAGQMGMGFVAQAQRIPGMEIAAIAVAVDGGLVVPVVRNADGKTLTQVAREARELIGRAREGKLAADDLGGGTFTVSNLGMFGVEQFTAVINPPRRPSWPSAPPSPSRWPPTTASRSTAACA